MSSKQERKAEHAVKSVHKHAKKRKSTEVFGDAEANGNGSEVASVNGAASAMDEEALKRAHKAEKKKRKQEQKEHDAAAAVTPGKDSPSAAAPPAKKSKTSEQEKVDADATSKAERKAAKKKAKEEKGAAKAAGSAAAEALTTSSSPISSAAAAKSGSTNAAAARAYMEANNITIEAPEESTAAPPLPMLGFGELEGRVDARLRTELASNKFPRPTPIQACCWSVLLAGKDVVGIAETGSGKTIAFGLPAMQHILEQDRKGKSKAKGKGGAAAAGPVSVLVIAPTRELALQTQATMEKIAASIGYASICLYGGVSKHDQIRQLRSSPRPIRAVVGTPGRVLDLAREGTLDLSNVSYAVLDEADRMLDVGFEPDIRAILGMTKDKTEGRHTSMFSATWPMNLRGLAETFMVEPMRVTIGSDELSANHRVEQSVEVLEDGRAKQSRLESFLREIGAGPRGRAPKDKVIIFALYKKEAQRVEDNLRRRGYAVAGIHGDLSQAQRIASLDAFKAGESPLLVATDVAARGIDVPLVEYVVNYTFPLTIEDYVHRIGRTGRAGRTGKSITFFTAEDKAHAGELVRILKDSNQPVPDAMNQFPTTIKRKEHGAYGAHFRELVPGKAKKITFDD